MIVGDSHDTQVPPEVSDEEDRRRRDHQRSADDVELVWPLVPRQPLHGVMGEQRREARTAR
jgi:hypothetical protein